MKFLSVGLLYCTGALIDLIFGSIQCVRNLSYMSPCFLYLSRINNFRFYFILFFEITNSEGWFGIVVVFVELMEYLCQVEFYSNAF